MIPRLGAFIGGLCLFFSFELETHRENETFSSRLVDFLEMCYIFLFGGVLALMDTPCFKTMKTVREGMRF